MIQAKRARWLIERFTRLMLTREQRLEMWPPVEPLRGEHISNCRLIENRDSMLHHLPKGAICAELGVFRGDFSEKILRITRPVELHLIDVDSDAVELAHEKFGREVSDGRVTVHHGDPADTLLEMPDEYFDWIYIDADHSYEGVRRVLETARVKLKPDGMIALNDYCYFAPTAFAKYGVVEAVNEFCLEHDYEIVLMALQTRMYNDVVIRKRGASSHRPEVLSKEQRREMWPPAEPLRAEHVRNARVVENRDKMLHHLPKEAVCAELGIYRCEFSAKILTVTQPAELHLIDTDSHAIEIANEKFGKEIHAGRVIVHHGDSADTLFSTPDEYFDWIYIDADHFYEGVKRDLAAARVKLKPDGLIALNDYCYFAPMDFVKYGIVEAVNEFCVEHDFEIVLMALQTRLYNDVVIRKRR